MQPTLEDHHLHMFSDPPTELFKDLDALKVTRMLCQRNKLAFDQVMCVSFFSEEDMGNKGSLECSRASSQTRI